MAEITEKQVLQYFSEGIKLSGMDLTGLNLNRAVMSGVDFSGCDLRGINLRGANLSGCDLSDSKLSEANLRETNLRESDWGIYDRRSTFGSLDSGWSKHERSRYVWRIGSECGFYGVIYEGNKYV